jgi:hypothetical protein
MRKSNTYQQIFQSEEIQFSSMDAAIEDIKLQLSIDSATWGLDIYEKELGIKTDLNKPLNDRRSLVKSKLRGSGKADAVQIKVVADAYTDGNVVVSFNGHIVVRFTSQYGIPPNLDDLKSVLEEVKPAHLPIEYEFVYRTWDEQDSYGWTWDQLDSLNMTWDTFDSYRQ